jgi:hypothetical protein
MRRITLLIMSLLICAGSAVAQGSQPAPSRQTQETSLATVYVYRLDEDMVVANFFLWFRKTRPVYFSERSSAGLKRKNREIAALRNKQYFMLRLAPGTYIFDTRLMSGHLELNVAPGRTYYLWVDQGYDCGDDDDSTIGPPSCEDRSASVEIVSPERWAKDGPRLKPIERGDVKDRGLVIIPPGPPSNIGIQRSAHQPLTPGPHVRLAPDSTKGDSARSSGAGKQTP